MSSQVDQVLVVLGCHVKNGRPGGTLERRLTHASSVAALYPQLTVIMSGGKNWQGVSESSAMSAWWIARGPNTVLISEDQSMNTRQNALYVAQLCKERGITEVLLVTCDFHMPRARYLFQRHGLRVIPHPSPSPKKGWLRFRRQLREWGAWLISPFESLLK